MSHRASHIARFAAALIAVVLAAAPAQAAEGGGVMDLVFQIANFALLLFVLVYFARGPIRSFFADRRTQIQSDLDEAADLLQTAESRYAEWQRKLIDLEQETERIKGDGVRVAEEEAARIVSDAHAAAERIQRDAEATIEQELRRAQGELQAEAASLATDLAEKILREKLADPDRDRLLDTFIGSVESDSRGAN